MKLDIQRVSLKQQLDELRSQKNEISAGMKGGKPSDALLEKATKLKDQIQQLEKEYISIEEAFIILFKKIPNIATQDTPVGLTEEENVVVKQWGEIPKFDFPALNHYEIAAKYDWIDKERAANVAGSRFAYLKGDLVRLQLALMTWVMDSLSNEEVLQKIIREHGLTVSSKPFTPILPPYMIRTAPYDAMDRLEPREERYKIEGQDLWLQGSAEHVLGSMHANETFQESEMPVRYL